MAQTTCRFDAGGEMKLPAIQFYVGDWRKHIGVQSMPYHERGIWFEMLCLMHESEQRGKLLLNGKAMSHEQIARILGLDNQIFEAALTTLLTSGVADIDPETGAIISRRMVKDETIRKIRKECGKLGGNPDLVNQKPTTKVNQRPNQTPNQNTESEDEDETEVHPVLKLQAPAPDYDEDEDVDAIYELYPRKEKPTEAKKAIRRAIREHGALFVREKTATYSKMVCAALPNKADRTYIPHPASWFNAGGFLSEPESWEAQLRRYTPSRPDHRAERAAKQFEENITPRQIIITPKAA